MAFTELTKQLASLRQSKFDGWGTWCAKCGTGLAGKKAEVTQRTPSEKDGKWDVDNCVVLCPKCFKAIGNHTDILADSEIPNFQRYPKLWHGDTPYVIKHGQTSSGVKL
jgi:hypothetical protein